MILARLFLTGIMMVLLVAACGGDPTAVPAPTATTAAAAATAVPCPETVEDIFLFDGPNRQECLEAGARAEGNISIYSGLIVDQVQRPLYEAFEKEYPYIKVTFERVTTSKGGLQRVTEEYESGRNAVDILDSDYKVLGYTLPFYSPYKEFYPRQDPEGHWVSDLLFPRGIGYNVNLVEPSEVPKTWADLADPKWSGKVTIPSSSGFLGLWIGGLISNMGEGPALELLQKLSDLDVIVVNKGGPNSPEFVAAGEYELCICAVHHIILRKEGRGAPLDYRLPDGALFTKDGDVAPAKEAPNPNAAMLFLDFRLDPERGGQSIRDSYYIPFNTTAFSSGPFEGRTDVWFLTAENETAYGEEWMALGAKYFLE